jgi:hypothetical protein
MSKIRLERFAFKTWIYDRIVTAVCRVPPIEPPDTSQRWFRNAFFNDMQALTWVFK